jgi:calcineurin-like phosphoesterase family protein
MFKLDRKNDIWFCSDPHYNHRNLCRGVSSWSKESYTRDFKNLEEMNELLIKNINDNVKFDDILFCLGDWSFGGIDKIWKFRKRINCQNIHLILGNHDHHIENKTSIPIDDKNYKQIEEVFISINHYLEVEIGENKFVLSHYPMASWNGLKKGWIHLFGHCHLLPHQKLREGKSMDIGFDGHPGFRPYHINEILSILKSQPIIGTAIPKEIDHHQI